MIVKECLLVDSEAYLSIQLILCIKKVVTK